jgi:hypothetical protein
MNCYLPFKFFCYCFLFSLCTLNANWHRKELEPASKEWPVNITKSKKIVTSEDLENLKEYIKDTQFSGVVYLSDEKNTYRMCSEKFESINEEELMFAIHSIGKVYTGILTLIMLQEGVIGEDALFSPLEVGSFAMHSLPLNVQQQTKVATLYDTMVHRGGFGDYLGKYIGAIQSSLNAQQTPSSLYRLEDFLPFSDAEVFHLEPGEARYSNLGTLLVGLSIQYHYQKVEPLDYNAILKKHILDKAGIALFCAKPLHGQFNTEDAIAEYLCGSPAGGYWTTVKDLHTFGKWIKKKCVEDSDFMQLVEKYGQEFYSRENREISHGGRIPSSSAFFSVFLESGITIAIASDQADQGMPKSSQLYHAIVRNMLVSPSPKDITN